MNASFLYKCALSIGDQGVKPSDQFGEDLCIVVDEVDGHEICDPQCVRFFGEQDDAF